MTPEEMEQIKDIYFKSIDVANKIGPLLIEETDGDIPVTTTTTAILLAGFCIDAGISMHDSVDLLISSYKQALEFKEDEL